MKGGRTDQGKRNGDRKREEGMDTEGSRTGENDGRKFVEIHCNKREREDRRTRNV
jgi:hypothetical protein